MSQRKGNLAKQTILLVKVTYKVKNARRMCPWK